MSFFNNNNENNLFDETFVPVENPNDPWIISENPNSNLPPIYDMGTPPINPNDPWIMSENQQYSSNNPLIDLLGIKTNSNGNIPRAKQEMIKTQYPALSNIFGTKFQTNSMCLDDDNEDDDDGDDSTKNEDESDDEDGGDDDGNDDEDDEPVYPDDDGTLHGGIDYPGGDDNGDGCDNDPVDYPDWDPDGNEPNEPEEPSQENDKPYNNPTLFGSLLNNVLSQTLGITFNSAQQAAYYRDNDQTHSSDYKDSVQQLKTSINALNETHKIQQKNLDKVLDNVTSAKNQEDYSQNLKTYTQLREQAQSTQNLATRIQYAADNHDYNNVATEVQNYTIPDPPSTEPARTISDLDQNDWRYQHNTQLQAGMEKSFGNSSNTQPQYYFQQQANYNTVPVQNYYPEQQTPEHNFGTSDFPVFHLNVADDNAAVPIETSKTSVTTEQDSVLSSGMNINDFVNSLGKDIGANNEELQKIIATYNSPTGQKIQIACEEQLQIGIEKIMQECNIALNISKTAGTVAKKVAPYLAGIYIFQKTYEGFINGGKKEAGIELFKTSIEVAVTLAVAEGLVNVGMAALPAFAITLIVEYVLNLTGIFK